MALKVLPLAKATPELTRRFLHEIEIQKNLSHSNLVRFLGSGRDGNVHYMVHEFIDGGDLRELFHREGVLSIDVVAPFLSQIARGIHYLHENGIVHRDIKPANVLLVSTGEAKLTDLGLSLPFGQAVLTGTATDTVISTVAGTVDYMAPDQILDPAHPAPAWDVYSLGCTLYQLLTGTVPFSRSDAQQKLRARVQADAKDARIHHQAIPFDVADLLRSMLARNPVERPTASEVARRLNAWCPKGNSALTPFSLRHGFKG